MIVYKTFEEVMAEIELYKNHRVVDDARMTREVDVKPTLWVRLKHYLMGESIPLTKSEPRGDVRITPTTLYAHPDLVDLLRAELLKLYDNPLKDK